MSEWAPAPSSTSDEIADVQHPLTYASAPFPQILSLIDPSSISPLQYSQGQRGFGAQFNYRRGSYPLLGQGGSFLVRRALFDSLRHTAASETPAGAEYVVIKQPILSQRLDPEDVRRVRAVLLELKILRHKPIAEHPNIVRLLQIVWDTQDGPELAAPSLVLEYADIGPLSAFQDPEKLTFCSKTKRMVCLDVARGLQALHSHGIVHGDVKAENVLLFTSEDGSYRAKLSDFGCSLIGVVNEPTAAPRRLSGFSRIWRAPEYDQLLDPANLFQTDIYSYGLLVWRIMLNGIPPYRFLYWDTQTEHKVLATTVTQKHTVSENAAFLNPEEFDGLKSIGNVVVRLALDTLQESYDNRDVLDTMKSVLDHTLQMEPIKRCRTLDNLIDVLSMTRVDAVPKTDHKLVILTEGDFGIFSPRFPSWISSMRSMPPEFRKLIVTALTHSTELYTENHVEKGARLCLVLAICHIEYFCVHRDLQQAVEWATQAAQRGDITAQGLIKCLYDATKLSIPPGLPWKLWLVNAMKHKSFTAKRSLQENDPDLHDEVIKLFQDGLHQHDSANTGVGSLLPGLQNNSTLYYASYMGDVDRCRDILEANSLHVDGPDDQGETALHYACRNNQEDAARLLLSKGADPNAQSSAGVTPLHFATLGAVFGRNLIDVVVQYGCDVNAVSSVGYADIPGLVAFDYYCSVPGSALHWAVGIGDATLVETLLRHGADPNLDNQKGYSPLKLAIGQRSFRILDLLLYYSDQDKLPHCDQLLWWIGWGHLRALSRIIHMDRGMQESVIPVVELLEKYHIHVDKKALLLQGIDDDDVVVVDYCIRALDLGRGSDLGTYTHEEFDVPVRLDYLLGLAAMACCPAMVKTILHHLGNKIQPDLTVQEHTILGMVSHRTRISEEEQEEIAAALLLAGADVNAEDATSKTPLYRAVANGALPLVRILLNQQYTPLPSDLHKPLLLCLRNSRSKVAPAMLKLLLAAKPDLLLFPPNLSTSESNILHVICSEQEGERDDASNEKALKAIFWKMGQLPGGPERLRACIEHKPLPFQQTALHLAAMWGNIAAASFLLDQGADVNAHGDGFNFQTPLDVAENRDWHKFQHVMYPKLDNMAMAGGLAAEKLAYDKHTEVMIKLLKEKGGKNGHLDFNTLTEFSLDLFNSSISEIPAC